MADSSISPGGEGTTNPTNVEATVVEEERAEFLVIMWHGNGYKRAESWIRAESDDVISLDNTT